MFLTETGIFYLLRHLCIQTQSSTKSILLHTCVTYSELPSIISTIALIKQCGLLLLWEHQMCLTCLSSRHFTNFHSFSHNLLDRVYYYMNYVFSKLFDFSAKNLFFSGPATEALPPPPTSRLVATFFWEYFWDFSIRRLYSCILMVWRDCLMGLCCYLISKSI